MIQKNDLISFSRSFSHAFKGISYCIKNERNMRIHLCMIVIVSIFSFFYKVTSVEYIFLLLCMGLVVSAEMINTAIETLTNLESPSYNQLARIAKDVAAGAVLVASILSVVVGSVIFLKPDRLKYTLILIISTPLYWISFLIVIVLAVLFTFNGSRLFNEPTTKIYRMKNYTDLNKKKK